MINFSHKQQTTNQKPRKKNSLSGNLDTPISFVLIVLLEFYTFRAKNANLIMRKVTIFSVNTRGHENDYPIKFIVFPPR